MFKRFFFGFVMILGFVTAASAQTKMGGFYGGFNFGGAIGKSVANTSTVFSPTGYFASSSASALASASEHNLDGNAFSGGVEAGMNAQFENVVLGIETDYQSMRLDSSQSTSASYPCCTTTNFTITQSLTTRWLYTLRPRIGYLIGSAMLYGTAGLAVTRVDYQAVFTDTFANANESGGSNNTKAGFVGGLGVEYSLSAEHWSVKGEYLYTDFGRTTATSDNLTAFTPPSAFPENVFTHTMKLQAHIIRAGINYRW